MREEDDYNEKMKARFAHLQKSREKFIREGKRKQLYNRIFNTVKALPEYV